MTAAAAEAAGNSRSLRGRADPRSFPFPTGNIRRPATYALSGGADPSIVITYDSPVAVPSGGLRRRSGSFKLFRKCARGDAAAARFGLGVLR